MDEEGVIDVDADPLGPMYKGLENENHAADTYLQSVGYRLALRLQRLVCNGDHRASSNLQ